MKVIRVKVADLKPSELNVRMHPDRQIQEYVRSLNMFGQIRPIVIDDENNIIAGNGLYMALVKNGTQEADCYRVSGLSKKQKEKLMLADNKIYELGVMDNSAFDKILQDLEGDLDVPGWDEELLQTLTANVNEISEEINSYGSYTPESQESLRNAAERHEGTEKGSSEPFQTTTPIPDAEPTQGTEEASEEEETPAQEDTRRFIICPKCGEKIWL